MEEGDKVMAVRRDGGWVKAQRIAQMRKMLEGAVNHGVVLSKFVATCGVNMGLAEKTTMKYLQQIAIVDDYTVDKATDLITKKNPT